MIKQSIASYTKNDCFIMEIAFDNKKIEI